MKYHINTKENLCIYTCTDKNWDYDGSRVQNSSENVGLQYLKVMKKV